jgi:hypothetical protein
MPFDKLENSSIDKKGKNARELGNSMPTQKGKNK